VGVGSPSNKGRRGWPFGHWAALIFFTLTLRELLPWSASTVTSYLFLPIGMRFVGLWCCRLKGGERGLLDYQRGLFRIRRFR
jgi:hypothetical protein